MDERIVNREQGIVCPGWRCALAARFWCEWERQRFRRTRIPVFPFFFLCVNY